MVVMEIVEVVEVVVHMRMKIKPLVLVEMVEMDMLKLPGGKTCLDML
jgi:hypothetical protein